MTTAMKKSAQRRRKRCTLAVVRWSQKFSPLHRPLLGCAGRPKFNQLHGSGHYLYLQTQFGEDRCMQFRVIVETDPQTHPPTDRADYNTLRTSCKAPVKSSPPTNRHPVFVLATGNWCTMLPMPSYGPPILSRHEPPLQFPPATTPPVGKVSAINDETCYNKNFVTIAGRLS